MERHMDELGLAGRPAYFQWCKRNGFPEILQKTRKQRLAEIDAFHALLDKQAAESRLHRSPKVFVEAACRGDLIAADIDRPLFRAACEEIERSAPDPAVRASLAAFLIGLLKHGDFIFEQGDEGPFMRGLIKLHDRKVLWLRPAERFKPKSKNRDRMFGELARHVFDKYGDVPLFMDRVWLRGDRKAWRYRDWYIHLGRGHNLRTAKLPVPMTRKMAHEFLGAPANYTVEQAVRWGQLKSLGASLPVIQGVAGSRLARSFENDAFWVTYFRFLIEHPMIDARQIGPLADFVHAQKFTAQPIPGEARVEAPPQPGFSFRARTPETLLRQMAEWHQSLGKMRALGEGEYKAAPFAGIDVIRQGSGAPRAYAIRQLRNGADLIAESEALSHCVSSYHWSCQRGACTIWSLSRKDHNQGAYQRLVTLEVSDERVLVQARGLANREPDAEELSVIGAWAAAERLQVSGVL
jgi:PcfJ-like protein